MWQVGVKRPGGGECQVEVGRAGGGGGVRWRWGGLGEVGRCRSEVSEGMQGRGVDGRRWHLGFPDPKVSFSPRWV